MRRSSPLRPGGPSSSHLPTSWSTSYGRPCRSIGRFASARKLVGYTGLTPRVEQSGERDRRGPLRKNGPNYLRWALIEAAHSAGRSPYYRPVVERIRARHGRTRGSKIAAIEIGRRLTEAIWHVLTDNRPFAPAGAPTPVAA